MQGAAELLNKSGKREREVTTMSFAGMWYRCTTAQAVRELGITQNLLRTWRNKYGKLASESSGLSETELDRLRKENRRLRMEREIVKTNDLLRERNELRYQFIARHSQKWPNTVTCDADESVWLLCVTEATGE
jgi:transposase-like protein